MILPWLAMVIAVASVFAAAVWSAKAEREAALDDFSHEQAVLARAIALPFAERLARHLDETHATADDEGLLVDDVVLRLLGGAPALEHPGELMILVARPDREGFLTTDRRVIASSRLRAAVDEGAPNVEVPRDDATLFGLPRRLAVAGVASVPSRRNRSWGVVVLASARRLRVREEHEQWRLALTVLLVGLVIGGFARMAQLRQRRELELSRQVAISGVERDHDAALAKADKMATLAALSTGIAHELGTPLSVIVGRVDQVSERVARAGDERSAAALTIVLEQVDRIQRIVRGSLALARGESPALEQTDAIACLGRAADLVRHRFDNAGVSLVLVPGAAVPPIASDAPLFEQALVNLLLNACQATEVGGAVYARVLAVDGASHVAFVVEDEGTGISDGHAARATEPFFSTKREQGGSGLGLTIVREIVSHHAGTFTLARRGDARGTRATIVLPAGG